MSSTALDKARDAKRIAPDRLKRMGLHGVVGVGLVRVGDGCGLKVNLSRKPPESVTLPRSLGGVRLRFEVVGAVRKRA